MGDSVSIRLFRQTVLIIVKITAVTIYSIQFVKPLNLCVDPVVRRVVSVGYLDLNYRICRPGLSLMDFADGLR